MGMGIPSLVNRESNGSRERKRPDQQHARCRPPSPTLTATRRQDAANEYQRAEARKGKADTMSALSVKQ